MRYVKAIACTFAYVAGANLLVGVWANNYSLWWVLPAAGSFGVAVALTQLGWLGAVE